LHLPKLEALAIIVLLLIRFAIVRLDDYFLNIVQCALVFPVLVLSDLFIDLEENNLERMLRL
jgi:hypothetical protein